MVISKHIKDLVALALQDGILTYTERQTIIKEAKNWGENIKETEAYIDEELQKRLKSFSKEELTHCPKCGALVPLISDDCLFCGVHLSQGETGRLVINVSGAAADVIRDENRKTEIELQNPNKCQCGAPFPLVSNICPYCGRVLHKDQDSDQNIKNLIANINQSIDKLKQTLRPTFWMVLKYRLNVIVFYLGAVWLVLYVIFDYDWLLGISCTMLPFVFILMMITLFRNTISPVQKADEEYYDALHTYEQYQRQVATIYGEHPEAKKLLAIYATEINDYKQVRVKNRKKLTALMVSVMLMPVMSLLLTPVFTPSPSKKYMAELSANPIINEMTSFSKTISPMPDSTVNQNYSDFITVEGDTRLMFDALCKHHTNFDIYDITYQLRIDPVKIISTGKKNEQSDTCCLSIGLTDKDGHLVGSDLMPISIMNSKGKDFHTILDNGQGCIYAEFISRTASTQRLKEVADSAYYFIIF